MPRTLASGRVTVTGRTAVNRLQNLWTKSEELDNAVWNPVNITVVANAVANPVNAAVDADEIHDTVTNATHRFIRSIATSIDITRPMTLSLFAKNINSAVPQITIAMPNLTDSAVFHLVNGTVVVGGSAVATMEYFGNGWYRCSVTATPTASAFFQYFLTRDPVDVNQIYAGDASAIDYFWGAQLVNSNWNGDYQPTTTTAVLTGLRRLRYGLT